MTHPLTGPVIASCCERAGDGEIERDRERERMKEGAEMRETESKNCWEDGCGGRIV